MRALAISLFLLAAPATAGPCGGLGPLTLCALAGGSALSVVEVCPDLPAPWPATLIASLVPVDELGETLGGGFTHRQVHALVLVGSAGALRIGKATIGAAARDARIHAPDPKHIQIAVHAQGFCKP